MIDPDFPTVRIEAWVLPEGRTLQYRYETLHLHSKESWSIRTLSIYQRFGCEGRLSATLIDPVEKFSDAAVIFQPTWLDKGPARTAIFELRCNLPVTRVAIRFLRTDTLGDVLLQLGIDEDPNRKILTATLRGKSLTLSLTDRLDLESGVLLDVHCQENTECISDSTQKKHKKPRMTSGDEFALMQAGSEDPVDRLSYLTEALEVRAIACTTWYHPWSSRDEILERRRLQNCRLNADLKRQLEGFWADITGGRSLIVFPVRPMPSRDLVKDPTFILTNRIANDRAFILFDFLADSNSRRGTAMLRILASPTSVDWVFDQLAPAHRCREENQLCFIQTGPRRSWWHQDIELWSGIHLKLFEIGADSASDTTQTTCQRTCSSASQSTDNHEENSPRQMEDEAQLMQRTNPPRLSRLWTWVIDNSEAATVAISSWRHDAFARNSCQANKRILTVDRSREPVDQIWRAWRGTLVDRPYVVLVTDTYPDGGGPATNVIILDGDDEHVTAVLVDYSSDDWVLSRTCLWDNAFPSFEQIFSRVAPYNQCHINICRIRVRDRTYRRGERIPLFEGSLLRLTETRLLDSTDSDSEATREGSTTETCETGSYASSQELSDENSQTQLPIALGEFTRDSNGSPINVRLQRNGISELYQHEQAFRAHADRLTLWADDRDLIGEVRYRQSQSLPVEIVCLIFDDTSELPYRLVVKWEAAQNNIDRLDFTASLRKAMWGRTSPSERIIVGPAAAQPSTRQQNGRDDLYVLVQADSREEQVIMVVINYATDDIDQYFIRAIHNGHVVSRDIILEKLVMTGLCAAVRCKVGKDGVEWQHTHYPISFGERVDVEVRLDEEPEHCTPEHQQQESNGMPESPELSDDSELMQRSLAMRHAPWMPPQRRHRQSPDLPLEADIEQVRRRTQEQSMSCERHDVNFFFVHETSVGNTHWVGSCASEDYTDQDRFRLWFLRQLPSGSRGPRRAYLTSTRLMRGHWSVLVVRQSSRSPAPVILRLLWIGTRFPALHVIPTDGSQSAWSIYSLALGEGRTEECRVATQVNDMVVNPHQTLNLLPGTVLDIQEIEHLSPVDHGARGSEISFLPISSLLFATPALAFKNTEYEDNAVINHMLEELTWQLIMTGLIWYCADIGSYRVGHTSNRPSC